MYAEPGFLLLARSDDGERLGCVGLRSMGTTDGVVIGEIRRLFVRAEGRGMGLGRRLVDELAHDAYAAGIGRLVLNTLPEMAEATSLYTSMGFEQCEPYVDEPLDGVLYYSRRLT